MKNIIKKNLLLCLLICCGLLVFLNCIFDFINKIKITMESANQNDSTETSTNKSIKTYKLGIGVIDYSNGVRYFYKTYETNNEFEDVKGIFGKYRFAGLKEKDAISLLQQHNFIEASRKDWNNNDSSISISLK